MFEYYEFNQASEEQDRYANFFDNAEWNNLYQGHFVTGQISPCIYLGSPARVGSTDYGRPYFNAFLSSRLPRSDLLGLGSSIYSEEPQVKQDLFINVDKFNRHELSQLQDLGYIMTLYDGRMLLNPLVSPFLSQFGKEVLDNYLSFQNDFVRRYMSLAKCFYRDDKGEINFISDNSLQELHNDLPNFSTGVSVSAINAILQTMWGKELELTRFERAKKILVKEKTKIIEKTIDLVTLRSQTTSSQCPFCGQMANERPVESGTFERKFQDVPVTTGRALYVHIKGARKYVCRNPDCVRYNHSFHEQFEFLPPYAQRSNRLNALILSCAINESFLDGRLVYGG